MASMVSPDHTRQSPTPTLRPGRAPSVAAHPARFVDSAGRADTDAVMTVFDHHVATLYHAACLIAGPDLAADAVEALMIDICHRPARYDLDDGALLNLLQVDVHRQAVDMLISTDCERFAQRFGPVAARKLASLPSPEREPIVLGATHRYTSRSLAAVLGEPPSVLAARIRAGLVRLRADASVDRSPSAGFVVGEQATGGGDTRWRS